MENKKKINITTITIHDKGKYECLISYQPEVHYISDFFLDVHGMLIFNDFLKLEKYFGGLVVTIQKNSFGTVMSVTSFTVSVIVD